MADSFLYQLFFPHNVRLHVILLLNIDIFIHTGPRAVGS